MDRTTSTAIVIADSTHLPMLENVDETAEALVQIFERAGQRVVTER